MGKVRDRRLRDITAAVTFVPDTFQNYSQSQKDLYQKEIDINFDYATSVYTVQQELVKGSMIFEDTKVRIVHIIEATTGQKVGDDFKSIIFPDMLHPKGMGMRYYFDNNYWITINTDYYRFVTASTVVRRCNNTVNWILPNGQLHEEVCIIDYKARNDTFDYNLNVNIPRGDIIVTLQCNEYTKLIKIDDRFLFNGQAFRCRFINNYLHLHTIENESTPLVYLVMIKDNINVEDDIVNNIANANQYSYTLSINEEPFEQIVGYNGQLTATVKLNDDVVTVPLLWESDDISIATIDNNGNFTLLSVGTVVFTCKMQDNINIRDTLNVVVSNTPVVTEQIIITPNQSQILQTKFVDYNVYKYNNDIVMPDTFTITVSGVPSDHYILDVIDGNNFRVINVKMYVDNALHVKCVSNIDASEAYIDISLKGAW